MTSGFPKKTRRIVATQLFALIEMMAVMIVTILRTRFMTREESQEIAVAYVTTITPEIRMAQIHSHPDRRD